MNSARLTLLLVAALAVTAAPAQDKGKEIVKSTRWFSGRFVGFEVGDYVHAIFKDSKGKERTFYIGEPGLDFFLALNVKKSGTFTYQNVNAYMEEAGGRVDFERLTAAKIGRQTAASWWKAQVKKLGVDGVNKKYQPVVDKLTRNGG